MLGLFVIGLALAWVFAALFVAKLVTRVMKPGWVKLGTRSLIFMAVLPLPFADELAAWRQVHAACTQYPRFKIEPGASGKTVYLGDEQLQPIAAPVFITVRTWPYVDVGTGNVQARYTDVLAGGGWFARGIGGSPFLFRSYCAPSEPRPHAEEFARHGVTYVEPPNWRK
jgi:hypothetical protein